MAVVGGCKFLVVYSQLLEKSSGNETMETLIYPAAHCIWIGHVVRYFCLSFVLEVSHVEKNPGVRGTVLPSLPSPPFSCACESAMSSRRLSPSGREQIMVMERWSAELCGDGEASRRPGCRGVISQVTSLLFDS